MMPLRSLCGFLAGGTRLQKDGSPGATHPHPNSHLPSPLPGNLCPLTDSAQPHATTTEPEHESPCSAKRIHHSEKPTHHHQSTSLFGFTFQGLLAKIPRSCEDSQVGNCIRRVQQLSEGRVSIYLMSMNSGTSAPQTIKTCLQALGLHSLHLLSFFSIKTKNRIRCDLPSLTHARILQRT